MSEWKEYKLGELTIDGKGSYGIAAPAVDYDAAKYTYLRITDINDDGTLNKNGLKSVDDKNAPKYLLQPNDIVFARTGASVGRSYFYDERDGELVYAGFLIKYSIDPLKVNPKILKFYTHSQAYYDWIQTVDNGATRGNINAQTYASMPIILPERKEQDKIVSTLSSLDDKIDLLRRENATLEAMAETLFRQWFVEEVKEDWEEKPLGDVVKTTSGGTPSRKHTEYYEDGTIEWVKSKELDGTFISSTEEMITKEAVANSSAKMLPEKSVLIAMYGATVGEFGILSKPMTCNQAVCALIPNKNYPYTYLYIWTALMKDEFINLASGAAQQNISQDLIKQQLVCSDTEKIMQYDKLVRGYFDKMENNQKQIQTLIQTRDGLLPRLMNNEIKI
ncbi:MAG: restriction endonuclease subunit S [Salinivirgaceae bacterium]|nr:restriction endonuclease subunit S [Salinivirgaceae bacterium]